MLYLHWDGCVVFTLNPGGRHLYVPLLGLLLPLFIYIQYFWNCMYSRHPCHFFHHRFILLPNPIVIHPIDGCVFLFYPGSCDVQRGGLSSLAVPPFRPDRGGHHAHCRHVFAPSAFWRRRHIMAHCVISGGTPHRW